MDIRLTLVNDRFTGIEALDRRRALGLPDGDHITFTTETRQSGSHTPFLNIDEAFARAWFGYQQTTSFAQVRTDMLAKGDVEPCQDGAGRIYNDYAVTFADLPPERIKELYVAVRFAACREQVERLQQEVDTLKAQIVPLESAREGLL